jgi:hypothetical protein
VPIRQDLYARHARGKLIASALRRLGVCLAAAIVSSAVWAEQPKTYSADGWQAACDATTCRASRASNSGNEALLVGRWKGTDGLAFGLATPRTIADRDRPMDLRIDDKVALTLAPSRDYVALEHVESFWITNGGIAAKIAMSSASAPVASTKSLRLSYLDMVGAPHDADVALDGLDKLAAFMATTLGEPEGTLKGVAPPKSVAAAPATSRIDLIRQMGVPDRLMARHLRAAASCDDPNAPRLKAVKPMIGALSKVAILYAIPCIATPDSVAYRIWIIETGEIGGITPQYFAIYDPKFGWKGSDLLYNVGYDEAFAQLTSTMPRQGSACGHQAAWVWKDYAFALQSFELTAACPGARASKIYPAK